MPDCHTMLHLVGEGTEQRRRVSCTATCNMIPLYLHCTQLDAQLLYSFLTGPGSCLLTCQGLAQLLNLRALLSRAGLSLLQLSLAGPIPGLIPISSCFCSFHTLHELSHLPTQADNLRRASLGSNAPKYAPCALVISALTLSCATSQQSGVCPVICMLHCMLCTVQQDSGGCSVMCILDAHVHKPQGTC